MSHAEHSAHAPRRLGFAVVTVSDSRSAASDGSGDAIATLVEKAGHAVLVRALVRDEPSEIRHAMHDASAEGVDVVVFTGGTGVARRDVTIETLSPRFAKRLPGFGELFRALSFQEIGAGAIASRAEAGVVGDRLVFLLPGSPGACRLAMERIILPESPHLVGQLRKRA